jgi:hypothetical protein
MSPAEARALSCQLDRAVAVAVPVCGVKTCPACGKVKPVATGYDLDTAGRRRKHCRACVKGITTGTLRWCEGCLAYHPKRDFPDSRVHEGYKAMRCRAWLREHEGAGRPGRVIGMPSERDRCVICGALAVTDEDKAAHYSKAHPERTDAAESLREGWRRARRGR